jgi:hypothetical protein
MAAVMGEFEASALSAFAFRLQPLALFVQSFSLALLLGYAKAARAKANSGLDPD